MVRFLVVFVAALVLLVGLFLFLRPDVRAVGGPRERAFRLTVEDGKMKPEKVPVNAGDRVTLRLTSDAPLEVHVHGYGLARDVGAGRAASVTFGAGITGRFGIEDHRSGRELGVLLVRPR